jgi:hypothetical protein
MTAPLIPQAFWFRLALSCPRVDGIPRPKGPLLDLPASCALPDFGALDDRSTWSEVKVAWNPAGLAVAVEVKDKPGEIRVDPSYPELKDGADLWIDTRDTRDVHRATRFCHRFSAQIVPASNRSSLEVTVRQKTIHRALADAPTARADLIEAIALKTRTGWRTELFFRGDALNGFDPETNRRLGFYVVVTDPLRGDQFLGVGREFPFAEDPSLWATLELRDS